MEIPRELSDALGFFIRTLKKTETRSAYGGDIADFFKFLTGLPDVGGNDSVISRYFLTFEERKLAPTTWRRRRSSLGKFIGYVNMKSGRSIPLLVRLADDITQIESKWVKPVQHYVAADEISDLVVAIEQKTQCYDETNSFRVLRNRMIVSLFYGFGLKIGELKGVYCDRLPVFNDASESQWRFATFHGRNIPIKDVTKNLYDEYLRGYTMYNEAVKLFQDDEDKEHLATIPFMPNKDGVCMSVRGIRRVIEMCGTNSAGVRITPGMLRSGYVKQLREASFSDDVIQTATGLESSLVLHDKYASMARSRQSQS